MKVLVFGATGMIGYGVLLECLDEPAIDKVVTVGRRPVELEHTAVEEPCTGADVQQALRAMAMQETAGQSNPSMKRSRLTRY